MKNSSFAGLNTKLTGAKVFNKLDLSYISTQLNIDKKSQQYLTINTHMRFTPSHNSLWCEIITTSFPVTKDKILEGAFHSLKVRIIANSHKNQRKIPSNIISFKSVM